MPKTPKVPDDFLRDVQHSEWRDECLWLASSPLTASSADAPHDYSKLVVTRGARSGYGEWGIGGTLLNRDEHGRATSERRKIREDVYRLLLKQRRCPMAASCLGGARTG